MLTTAEFDVLMRHDLMTFVERSFYELTPQTRLITGPHLEVIASKLEACRQGFIKRLIITLPPRHLKSHCASVAFVAWCLGHDPAKQIICVSYGQDLADKLARDCRNIMATDWYKRAFGPTLAERQALHDFMTVERGFRMSTSVGGVLTGRGADILVIDDPLKPDEALSETRRSAVNEWYDNTLLSRLNDKANGVIIIIMQRLHQDDLVGHVLEQEAWDVVSFPAIAEEHETHVIETPYGRRLFVRNPGDVLHPARENLVTLKGIRQTIGEYTFASQYQQTPLPLGGGMVKTAWLRYYEPDQKPSGFLSILQSWDTANKTTELSDYSVCTTWGLHDRHYYLLDVLRRRLNYPDLKRTVIDHAQRFRPNRIVIEDKASGTQLIQDIKASGTFGVTPYLPPPGSDKPMRLYAQTALFENGLVVLPRSAPWLADYVAELTGFPGTKYDDQIDSTTQALAHFANYRTLETWARLGQTP